MTRQRRRSKSQIHNRMKRQGYKWHKHGWWELWRFNPFLVKIGCKVPIYHSDYEEAK